VVRLWVAASDYREDVRLSGQILDKLSEGYRKIRNTLRYCLSQLYDFDPAKDAIAEGALYPIDRWALARVEAFRAQVQSAYETYEFHRVYHATLDLCATDLSAVYFDALKDRTYCSGHDWPGRRAAQTALYSIVDTLARMLAPMASFTAEEVWGHLPKACGKASSVFLAGLPKPAPHRRDAALEAEFSHLLVFREVINGRLEELRAKKALGKATEADVTLVLSAETLAGEAGVVARKYADSLGDLFLCASATVRVAAPGELPEGKALDALIVKSPHASCERCYRALPEVGQDQAHPTLCARCVRAVGSR
jgi:isoleucyl-tRNA synthetase